MISLGIKLSHNLSFNMTQSYLYYYNVTFLRSLIEKINDASTSTEKRDNGIDEDILCCV